MRALSVVLFYLIVVAGAANGLESGERLTDESAMAQRKFLENIPGKWVIGYSADGKTVVSLTGRPDTGPPPPTALPRLFPFMALFRRAPKAAYDAMTLSRVDSIERYEFPQSYRNEDGIREPIENAFLAVTISPNGLYDIVINSVPEQIVGKPVRDVEEAKQIAIQEFDRDMKYEAERRELPSFEDWTGKVFGGKPVVTASADGSTALLAVRGKVHRVYHVTVRADVTKGPTHNIVAIREYAVDASTITDDLEELVVRTKDLSHNLTTGKGRVFDPHPLTALNLTSLGLNEVPNAEPPYCSCDLVEMEASNGVFALAGPLAEIRQKEGPPTEPPSVAESDTPPAQFTKFLRGTPEFAAVMAYCHVARMQKYIRDDLNLPERVPPRLQIDVHAIESESTIMAGFRDLKGSMAQQDEHGYVWLGKKGEKFIAEDAEVIAHEYAHAVLAHRTNGRFNINFHRRHHPDSQARPISEGLADYWGVFSFFQQTPLAKLDCFAEWANDGNCFRTLTNKPSHDRFKFSALDEENGEIWSGTLFDLFLTLNDPLAANAIIIQGHWIRAFKGDAPTMKEMAEGIIISDGQLFNGVHKQTLCDVFCRHGISTDCCSQSGCIP